MKRLLLSLAMLLGTLVGRAQSYDITDFITNAPWTLTPREVELNYQGVESYPLLEALYPISGEAFEKLMPILDPNDCCTYSGFSFGEFDAYVALCADNYDGHFEALFSFISPEQTEGVAPEVVLMGLYSQLYSQLGEPSAEETEVQSLPNGISLHLFDSWISADCGITIFCITIPEISEEPLLYGYIAIYDPGEEYVEEVEYTVEAPTAEAVAESPTEAVAEEPATSTPLALQDISYLINNAPWGCSRAVFEEMFVDRTAHISEALKHAPNILQKITEYFTTERVISGYAVGDYELYIEYPFYGEDHTSLSSLTAIIVPEGEVTTEVLANVAQSLTATLGSPFMEGTEVYTVEQNENLVQTMQNTWVTEQSIVYISTICPKDDLEHPLVGFIRIADINMFLKSAEEEEEKTNEEELEELWEQVSAFENDNEAHMHFRGISLNKEIYEFCKELEGLGYTKVEEEKDSSVNIWLTGYYGGEECVIYVCSTPSSNKVFLVRVLFAKTSSWNSLRSTYNTFQRRLTNKFGEPEVVEQFQNVYEEGSGLEMAGLESGHIRLLSEYNNSEKTGLGFIQLSVTAANYEGYVFISFYDSINLILREKELEEQM